jgi:hypothetical protein
MLIISENDRFRQEIKRWSETMVVFGSFSPRIGLKFHNRQGFKIGVKMVKKNKLMQLAI